MQARYYLTPPHTFSGIYILVGGRFGLMGWEWAEPVTAPDEDGSGTDTIERDYLTFFSGYLGMGLSLIQTTHFRLGVNVSGGFKVYNTVTVEGFDNDVFGDGGISQVMFTTTFGNFVVASPPNSR